MVRGRQLDPALRARIFELRAAGNGAKRIHKLLPDVPFNTIKTTLRRSKTAAASTPAAGDTTSRLHPGSDDSPSPLPALDGHRDVDVGAALAGHSLSTAAAGPNNPLAPLTSLHRGLPGTLPPQQVTGVVKQQHSHHQSQQQQQQQQQQQHQQQQHQQHQQQQQQQQAQQQQQQQQQQKQQHHQTSSVSAPQLPRPSSNIAPTLPGDPQTRRARDLINEIDILPGAASTGTNGVPAQTLDLERLKTEYRNMPEAQRLAAENELDMRKAALVTAKWEVQRELDAARRQAQIDQLQALQQEGLDPETFYVRFRQLVQPSSS